MLVGPCQGFKLGRKCIGEHKLELSTEQVLEQANPFAPVETIINPAAPHAKSPTVQEEANSRPPGIDVSPVVDNLPRLQRRAWYF